MAIICAAGVIVWGYVASWGAAVWLGIASIATAVYSAVVAIAVWVASVVGGAIAGIAQGLGIVTFAETSASLAYVGLANYTSASVALAIADYIMFVGSMWKAFAEAIHFKTILAVQEILYLVSSKYRNMRNKLYNELSSLSEALEMGSAFLPLALRNARAIVLDASTTLGKSYDLSEVGWLYNLSDWLKKVESKAALYKMNPNAIFVDIDELLIKPAMDTKAEGQRALFEIIDNTIKVVDGTVRDVIKVRDSLGVFISDLPGFIQDEIRPHFNIVLKQFDDFMKDVYHPGLDTIAQITNAISHRLTTQQKDAASLIKKLKFPATYLGTMDDLPEDQTKQQEDKLYDLTNRIPRRGQKAIEAASVDTFKHLDSMLNAMRTQLAPIHFMIFEQPGSVFPPDTQADDASTWFVGDY